MKNILIQFSAIAITFLFATTSCNNASTESNEQVAETPAEPVETPVAPAIQDTTKPVMAKEDKIYAIKTSEGVIKIKVYKECPIHMANFDKLVAQKFYDGILFHRVIKGFMIQTGDPDSKKADPNAQYGIGGPGYTIPAEILPQFYHKKGALAAARQGDQVNPYKESSGSQFYIVQGRIMPQDQLVQFGGKFSPQAIKDYGIIGGTPELDGEYTVFGETIEGIDIVEKIANTITVTNDRPKKDIKIISIIAVTK